MNTLIFLFVCSFFDGNSVATVMRSNAIFTNPAGLGIYPGIEMMYCGEFGEEEPLYNMGISLKNWGIGIRDITGGQRILKIGSGSRLHKTLYYGSIYTFQKGSKYKSTTGITYRPKRFLSIGLTGEWEESVIWTFIRDNKIAAPYLRGGVAVRPFTDRLTLFCDGEYDFDVQDEFYIDSLDYSYGIGIEPIDGVILSFIGNKNKDISLNLGVSFGKVKIGGGGTKFKEKEYRRSVSFLTSLEPYPTFIPKRKKLVELTLEGSYPEIEEGMRWKWLTIKKRKAPFYELLKKIDVIKERKDAYGVFVNFKTALLGVSQGEEIRNSLLALRKKGKKVFIARDYYGFESYWLASCADKIILTPTGSVEMLGIGAKMIYLKGTMEKLGISADIERVGKYKSAAEPFERKDMSEEDREQLSLYLDELYEPLVRGIAKGRDMAEQRVHDLINEGVYFNSDAALESGLIDILAYSCELDSVLKDITGKKVKRTTAEKFLKDKEIKREWKEPDKKKIALIIAEGSILTGKSGKDRIMGKYMGSETISKILEKARKDKSIKAVVFRINSGGGSALASEIIANSIKRLAEKKPVIVSMGNIAGSGGYYIACLGDTILADEFTLTGSIGVIGMKFVIKGLYDKLGISWDIVQKGDHADMWSDLRHMTDEEKQKFKQGIEWWYKKFVDRVAEGRDTTFVHIDSIGKGRIWSGKSAKDIGLIDEIGGIFKAIEIAAEKAGIKDAAVVLYPERTEGFDINMGMGMNLKMLELLSEHYLYIMPYTLEISD